MAYFEMVYYSFILLVLFASAGKCLKGTTGYLLGGCIKNV